MAKNEIPKDIQQMSFEEALKELDDIVGALEHGSNKLDDAVKAYERGTFLKEHCEAKLDQAKERISKIGIDSSGEISVKPFDSE